MKKTSGILKKSKRLLFLGDSLIEYFDWSERFPDHDAYNLGIAGETVEGLHSRLSSIYRKVKCPDMVFIMTGINSIAMGDDSIAETYRKIVQEIRQAYPSAKVIVQSLLPVLIPFIANEDIRHMNARLKQMAIDEKVLYLDIHTGFLDEKGKPMAALLLEDGVHVSAEGYRVWSGRIERFFCSWL